MSLHNLPRRSCDPHHAVPRCPLIHLPREWIAIPPHIYEDERPVNLQLNRRDVRLSFRLRSKADLAAGTLPPVSFVKPIGANNEHPGYTDVVTGQQHVADLVKAVQQSRIWKDCVILITYDENGGRVPGIIVSPFARKGVVDSHEYETVSILKLIERRFNLAPLSTRDADPAVSDLTTALDFDRGDD